MTQQSGQSILDALDSDHRAALELLARATAESDPDELAARCEQLVMDVVRHLVAEEQYLLPLVREHLGDGAEHSDAAFAEHADIENTLRQLEDVDRSPVAVAPLLDAVGVQLRAHVERQDGLLFAALRASVDPAELVRLGEEVIGSEQLAPTRPRELRPESPTVNKLVSIVQGWVDHVRDSYTHRGVDPD